MLSILGWHEPDVGVLPKPILVVADKSFSGQARIEDRA